MLNDLMADFSSAGAGETVKEPGKIDSSRENGLF
jgi:hypothetical protein